MRRDLANRVGVEGEGSLDPDNAARDLAMYDALLAGLSRREAFPDDEEVRQYVVGLAKGADEANKYAQAMLEHQAFRELAEALGAEVRPSTDE